MGKEKIFWVYILASKIGGTLYIGVTNDLGRRVFEHRSEVVRGFTRRYGAHRLVYFEQFSDIENASAVKSGSKSGIERGRSD